MKTLISICPGDQFNKNFTDFHFGHVKNLSIVVELSISDVSSASLLFEIDKSELDVSITNINIQTIMGYFFKYQSTQENSGSTAENKQTKINRLKSLMRSLEYSVYIHTASDKIIKSLKIFDSKCVLIIPYHQAYRHFRGLWKDTMINQAVEKFKFHEEKQINRSNYFFINTVDVQDQHYQSNLFKTIKSKSVLNILHESKYELLREEYARDKITFFPGLDVLELLDWCIAENIGTGILHLSNFWLSDTHDEKSSVLLDSTEFCQLFLKIRMPGLSILFNSKRNQVDVVDSLYGMKF